MDKGSSLPIKDFISLWYLLQRVGCSVQTPDSLFFTNTHLSFQTTGCSLVFSFFQVGSLAFKREYFVLSVRRISFVQLWICLILRCNLTHFALPSASFDVVICVISCAEMRHIAMCFDLSCRPISLILFVDFILAKSFPLFSGFPWGIFPWVWTLRNGSIRDIGYDARDRWEWREYPWMEGQHVALCW